MSDKEKLVTEVVLAAEDNAVNQWAQFMAKQAEVQAKTLELVSALMLVKTTQAQEDLAIWWEAYKAAMCILSRRKVAIVDCMDWACEAADIAVDAYKAKSAELAGKK